MPMSMSAADWTRLQRQRGGRSYGPTVMSIGGVAATNKDVAPTVVRFEGTNKPTDSSHGISSCPASGTPKTRRPASDWTNYIASGLADYVVESQGTGRAGETGLNNNYTKLVVNRICSCTSVITLPKTGICSRCAGTRQHLSMN